MLQPAKRTPPNISRNNKSSNTQRTENKTTDVVIHQQSRKLLTMDILMSETCWAHNKWNKIASDIKLVFHSSTDELLLYYAMYVRHSISSREAAAAGIKCRFTNISIIKTGIVVRCSSGRKGMCLKCGMPLTAEKFVFTPSGNLNRITEWYLTFSGPCIVMYSYNKSQRYALFLNFILVKDSTCFEQTYCPSSGVLILYSQQ